MRAFFDDLGPNAPNIETVLLSTIYIRRNLHNTYPCAFWCMSRLVAGLTRAPCNGGLAEMVRVRMQHNLNYEAIRTEYGMYMCAIHAGCMTRMACVLNHMP